MHATPACTTPQLCGAVLVHDRTLCVVLVFYSDEHGVIVNSWVDVLSRRLLEASQRTYEYISIQSLSQLQRYYYYYYWYWYYYRCWCCYCRRLPVVVVLYLPTTSPPAYSLTIDTCHVLLLQVCCWWLLLVRLVLLVGVLLLLVAAIAAELLLLPPLDAYRCTLSCRLLLLLLLTYCY